MSRHLGFVGGRWAAVGAIIAVSFGAGGLHVANATISTSDRSVFVPISPCRLFDTRVDGPAVGPRNSPLLGGTPVAWNVRGTNGRCTIPSDAVSVVMNITVSNPTAAGYLTIWPSDQVQPSASSLNWVAGQAATPNAVVAKLSASGQISTFANSGSVDVIADINGYYAHHNHDDRYYTKSQIGASYRFSSGNITLPPSTYTSGQVFCPSGTVSVGTGFSLGGVNSFVIPYGSFVGYFLTNEHSFDVSVSAIAICLQSPPPGDVFAEGVGSTTGVDETEWSDNLAQGRDVAAATGLMEFTQVP